MAGIIFWFSANTGQSINSGLGIISAFKAWMASVALAIAGHAVDVSPVGHFVEYLIFGGLLVNALRFHMNADRAVICVVAVLIASVYGITDEIHQYFVPERSCDAADWAVDTIAATLGSLATWQILKRHAAR